MMMFFKRILTGEFVRFAIVGGISAITEYALYFFFKLSINYLIANVIAFGLTNVMTFILNRRYVFSSANTNKAEEAALYFVFLLGALFVNQMVLWALVEFASIDDRFAKVVAIAVAVFWNFFTRKHIVFKNREAVPERTPAKNFRSRRF